MEIGIAYLLWDNPLNCIFFFFFLWFLDEDIVCFFNLDFFKKNLIFLLKKKPLRSYINWIDRVIHSIKTY